jgi:hypothetical protein
LGAVVVGAVAAITAIVLGDFVALLQGQPDAVRETLAIRTGCSSQNMTPLWDAKSRGKVKFSEVNLRFCRGTPEGLTYTTVNGTLRDLAKSKEKSMKEYQNLEHTRGESANPQIITDATCTIAGPRPE